MTQNQNALDMYSVNFHFYGLHIKLASTHKETVSKIRRDFMFFDAESSEPDITIEVFDEHPVFSALPDISASIYAVNYITYYYQGQVFTDYGSQGLRIFDEKNNAYKIYCQNPDLRHEISYLTILSTVGKYLDRKHIHRVHALGISQNGKGVLILLPEKGGKTTLALQLIRSDNIKLLSEDSPLINRQGEILPFPLRLGILPGGETGIPEKYLYPVYLMRTGIKMLVDIDYFADKIGTACKLQIILLGERYLGTGAKIEPASRFNGLKELVKNSVVGMGLHQGMEYLIGRNIWETFGRSNIAASRLRNSMKAVSQCQIYRYFIGHDLEANARVLLDFLAQFR